LNCGYKDEDIDVIHQQLEQEYGAANFEAFINLLVSHLSCLFDMGLMSV
jgi:hypothetical protein